MYLNKKEMVQLYHFLVPYLSNSNKLDAYGWETSYDTARE